jgi:hypothetical protein
MTKFNKLMTVKNKSKTINDTYKLKKDPTLPILYT